MQALPLQDWSSGSFINTSLRGAGVFLLLRVMAERVVFSNKDGEALWRGLCLSTLKDFSFLEIYDVSFYGTRN